jgi:hypothetical protein
LKSVNHSQAVSARRAGNNAATRGRGTRDAG